LHPSMIPIRSYPFCPLKTQKYLCKDGRYENPVKAGGVEQHGSYYVWYFHYNFEEYELLQIWV
ncbi:3119_t:CDS:2, partial [Scutellospora calospora]